MTGRKDNLHTYKQMYGVTFTDEENILLHVVNAFGDGPKIHLGSLPFVNRPFVIACLEKYENAWGPSYTQADLAYSLREKLTPEVEWVDVTTMQDVTRKKMHLITGEICDDGPMGIFNTGED